MDRLPVSYPKPILENHYKARILTFVIQVSERGRLVCGSCNQCIPLRFVT